MGTSYLDKLENLNAKMLQLITLLTVIILILYPLVLPLSITQVTRDFYTKIENIPEGSFVILTCSHGEHEFAELQAGYEGVAYQLLENNIKFGWVTSMGPLVETAMSRVTRDVPDVEYGVDWVNFGLLPGGETGMSAFAKDMRNTISRDFRGNNVDELPIMENVNSIDDWALVIGEYSSDASTIVRQYWAPYDKEILLVSTAGYLPQNLGFYPTAITAYLNGVQGMAEYEILINRSGLSTVNVSVISVTSFLFIGILLIGNIPSVVKFLNKGRED